MRNYTIALLLLLVSHANLFAQTKIKDLLEKGYAQVEASEFRAALETANSIIFKDPDNFQGYGLKGVAEVRLGMLKEGMTNLTYAMNNGVKNAFVYAHRGVVYQSQEEMQKAESEFNRAIAIDDKSYRIYTLRGLFFIINLEYDKALKDFDKVVSLASNDPKSYFFRGHAHYLLDNQDEAILDEKKALKLGSISPGSVFEVLSNCAYAQNRLEDAEDYLNQMLMYDSKNGNAWSELGHIQLAKGDTSNAIRSFEKAIDIDPENELSYLWYIKYCSDVGLNQQVIELTTAALDGRTSLDHKFLGIRAGSHMEMAHFDLAIVDFTQAILRKSNEPLYYINRGLCWYRTGKVNSGRKDFQSALRHCNNDPEIRRQVADAYFLAGDLANSKQLLIQLQEKGSEDPMIFSRLANIAFQTQDYENAVQLFDQAILKGAQDSIFSYCYRGHAKYELGLHDEANLDLDTLLSLEPEKTMFPEVAGILCNLGYLLDELERFEEAKEALDKGIALDSTIAYAYNNRGFARYKLGDFEGAILDFNKSIELKNDYFYWPPYNRANALKALKRYDEAIEDFNLAISYKADYAEAYNDRGETWELLGKRKLARADFEKALELNPELESARSNVARTKK